jgi:hypothetical protein
MALPRFRITERRALWLIMGASFLAYAATFIVAGFREHGQPLESSSNPRVHWMRPHPKPAAPANNYYLVADMFDPSLLSLPNRHGFSRALWQHSPTANPPGNDWQPTLAFHPIKLPTSVKPLLNQPELVATLQASAEKLPAVIADRAAPVETVAAPNRTVVLINGQLHGRALVATPKLPALPGSVAVKPTLVRIAVGPDGTVRHALLERSAGNDAADAQALALAPQLRFTPLVLRDAHPGNLTENLVWGFAKFVWAVTAQ